MSAVAGVPTRAVAGEGVQLVPTVPPQDFAVAGVLTVPPKIAQELPVD